MRKTIVVHGLISGGIIVILGFINTRLWKAGAIDFDNGEVFGYAAILIALSMVFFGIRSFRDKYLGGVIRFGKAFVVGLMITLIASAFYVAGWELYWQTDDELRRTFMDRYTEHILEELRAGGATDEQLNQRQREMEEMKVMYDIPIIRLAFTLVEILPIGLLVTLISAAILRRKEMPSA